jgi:Calcineurin-like phosphoesterase
MGAWKHLLLVGAVWSAAAGAVSAEELIRTPTGVVVRSLFDWEGAAGLDVILGDMVFPAARIPGGAEHFFAIDDLCDGAGYRIELPSDGAEPRHLGRFCPHRVAGTVAFAFISDTQEDDKAHRLTGQFLRRLLDDHPEIQFLVNGGDIVQNGREDEWKRYRAVASTLYTNVVPIVPVVGNHDYRDDPRLGNFSSVYGTSETSAHYYSLDLGSAMLIVLDSNVDLMTPAAQRAQTFWLARTLRAVEGRRPVIVTYHHPVESSDIANTVMPVPPRYIREHWLPLFREFGVKLVLNGHTHLYERLHIVGLWHVVAGPAGGSFGGKLPLRNRYSEFLLKKVRTVTLISIDGAGRVSLVTYDAASGRIVDTLAI